MPEINLTTRKTAPPKVPGTFVREQNPHTGKVEYIPRFSEAFQPEGHDYIRSFKVLRLDYWLKHKLIGQLDIAVYETIYLLTEGGVRFCLERLAEEMKISNTTLRKSLDNLENAELLDVTYSDGQGQPRYFLIRTPYFIRESLDGKSPAQRRRKDAIREKGREVPEIFLEDVLPRLRRQINSNRAAKRRRLLRRKDLAGSFKKFQSQLQAEIESKKLVWFSIVKAINSSRAANIDELIWRLAKSGFAISTDFNFNHELRAKIKGYLKQLNIGIDQFLIDDLVDLFNFYAPKIQRTERKEKTSTTPPNPAMPADTAESGDVGPHVIYDDAPVSIAENNDLHRQQENILLRSILKSRVDKSGSYTTYEIKEFARISRRNAPHLSPSERETILKSFFDAAITKKIIYEFEKLE